MKVNARYGCVAGCAIVGAMLMSSTAGAAANDVESAAADAVQQLRDAGISAQQRATAIAAVPSVVYGVATDQQTMLDLTADELSIHAQSGEIVEIAQQTIASGKITSLRREGAGELVHLPLGTPGLHVVVGGHKVYAISVVQLRPRDRAEVVRGLVGVAREVDLTPAAAKLMALGGAVELRLPTGIIALGSRPSAATTPILQHPPLGADVDPEVALFVPPPSASPVRTATLALFALGIAVGVVVFRRRRQLAAAVYAHVDTAKHARVSR